jgi:hypothetical protein
MAGGSDHTNEQLDAGRTNRSEDQTRIWAQRHEEGDDFNGVAVFIAELATDSTVDHTVHGIIGFGSNGDYSLPATLVVRELSGMAALMRVLVSSAGEEG